MHDVALVARLLLAIVFGVAAAAKALDMPETRRALTEFGAPEQAVVPGALLLPLAELATAVALLLRPSARWGAISAVCLLVLFMAAIARAMARGEAPSCQCFGKLASGLADRRALIRNVLLTMPAVFVVAYGPGEGIGQWVSGHSADELGALAAGACAAALAVLVARLWPQNQRLRRDLEFLRGVQGSGAELPVGAQAPSFSLPSADGTRIGLDALLNRGRPIALVFIGPSCSSCQDMLPDFARWQSTLVERITIALLSRGSVREIRAMVEPYGLENVLALDNRDVPTAYGMRATPSVVIIGRDGRIASRPHSTPAMTEAVIRNALYADPGPPHSDHPPLRSDPAPLPGDPAPALQVVTVNGAG